MRPVANAFVFWLPPLSWFLVIYALSATPITDLPRFDIPYADKLIHMALYFILGALLVRAMDHAPIRDIYTVGKHPEHNAALAKLAFLAIIISLSYGVTDELHQLIVPGRSCDIMDFFADCAGSIAGVTMYAVETLMRRRLPCRR